MKYLCDTNVLSELIRKKPDPGVLRWAGTVTTVALSVITVEELFYGLAWKENRRIQAWLESFLKDCTLLPVSEGTANIAGNLRGRQRRQGRTRSQADMLIAASALQHGLTLVTGNAKDFEGCELPLLDPFER